MMDYGMYTDFGNAMIHGVVESARLKKSTWPEVYQLIYTISFFDGYGEATDTAVRERVYDALGFESPFYC